MQALSAAEIRQKFLDFFQQRGHQKIASAPLVPQDDPTLLFTNAGMVPFKDIFTGKAKANHPRVVSIQKCIRAGGKHNDLDNVGRTARHHTFFEMLGNFSFGDYFKREAIQFAWEFLTEEIGLPAEKLWVTVFREDDEAHRMWQEITGIPESRIVRLDEEDNFWSMGDTGPCGPCSEIIIDRGEDYRCSHEQCALGVCDCDRWLEIWNLVFMQFERRQDGSMHPLPKPSIDTGMGLERLASVVQNVDSNFDTDLFQPIIREVERLAGEKYSTGDAGFPFRVIADHIRACTFLIGEGVLPGNEGRNYVLRRILRRAARFGRVLGIEGPFLAQLVPTIVQHMKSSYPELEDQQLFIQRAIEGEEKRFQETLDLGLKRLEELLENIKINGQRQLPGELCFQLYDTYGLPIDIIYDVCQESGVAVDQPGFEKELEQQRQRARADRDEKSEGWLMPSVDDLHGLPTTDFVGYESEQTHGMILALFRRGTQGLEKVERVEDTDGELWAVLDKTPFYAESGGQVGDRGRFVAASTLAHVVDTRKLGSIIMHKLQLMHGTLETGAQVLATIDRNDRASTKRNHTATHLLHAALRRVLGDHVKQAGSLVEPDRLRFDFTHFQALTDEQIAKIEDEINRRIFENLPVTTEITDLETARERGAMALFQEKYGEQVRVVAVGDYSLELCGGTHVQNTSEIGAFSITLEQGIAAGVRRIEAVTGMAVLRRLRELEQRQTDLAAKLKVQPGALEHKIDELVLRVAEQEKELTRLRDQLARKMTSELIDRAEQVAGVTIIAGQVNQSDQDGLRRLGDVLRSKAEPAVVILGTRSEEKASLLIMASKSAVQKGVHAGKAIGPAAKIAGGGGGGRPDMAQAGGKNPAMLDQALEKAKETIVEQLTS